MKKKLLFTVLFPFALGYFLTAIFRTINAIQAPFLTLSLHLNASELGLMTSAYLLGFGLCQLPLGILLDKWGPRLTQTVFFLCAAAGTVLFAYSNTTITLTVARFTIGIGLAGGFMSAVKANAQWFPDRIFLMNGIIMAAGGIGSLVSTSPTRYLIQQIGWRHLNLILAFLLVITSLLFYLLSPKDSEHKTEENFTDLIRGIIHIYQSTQFWQFSLAGFFITGTLIAMQGLWANPFLIVVNHLSEKLSADVLFVIAIAFIIGALLIGQIANWAKRHHYSLDKFFLATILLTMITEILIIFKIYLNPFVSWFLYALLAQGAALIFAILSQVFKTKKAGRAITAYNMLLFFIAFLIQFLFGISIHFLTTHYCSTMSAYQITFSILVGLQIVGSTPLFFKKSERF